jgi:putative tricarboxylic transport membrane protein
MTTIRNAKDVIAGSLFALLGLAALWLARDLDYGTVRQMGSGFIPRWLAAILFVLGAAIVARGFMTGGARLTNLSVRRLAMILIAVVVFGVAIMPLGLVLTTFACALIAAMAGNEFRRVEVLALAAALAAFSGLLFVWGLRLPFPLWPSF